MVRLMGLLASDGGLSCASGSVCCLIPFPTALPPLALSTYLLVECVTALAK
jgi:hypothetical protein